MKPKLIRITTIPQSLRSLLKGQLRFMSENGFEVIGVSGSGEALKEVQNNEGVQTVAIEMTRTISPFKDLKALVQLIQLFKKEKPEIVHTHTPKAGLLGMMAAKIAGVPHRLHTVAGMPLLEVMGAKRQLLNQMEKLTYACATKVYPNSYGLEKIILEEKFTSPKKLKVIGKGSSNGIDTSYFNLDLISIETKKQLREELNIAENDFVFVFVGRLVGDKGINELVQAFKQIRNPQLIKLLLVGPLESELDPLKKETLQEIEANRNIISVGFQKDVRPYFAISDSLVFPSYREGFPNVVMQAGAMGLPSIVSDINGCNEIIIEEQNGIIVPVKDFRVLKENMEELIENKSLVNELSLNARKLIESRYEQKIVWNEILKEYESLMNKL